MAADFSATDQQFRNMNLQSPQPPMNGMPAHPSMFNPPFQQQNFAQSNKTPPGPQLTNSNYGYGSQSGQYQAMPLPQARLPNPGPPNQLPTTPAALGYQRSPQSQGFRPSVGQSAVNQHQQMNGHHGNGGPQQHAGYDKQPVQYQQRPSDPQPPTQMGQQSESRARNEGSYQPRNMNPPSGPPGAPTPAAYPPPNLQRNQAPTDSTPGQAHQNTVSGQSSSNFVPGQAPLNSSAAQTPPNIPGQAPPSSQQIQAPPSQPNSYSGAAPPSQPNSYSGATPPSQAPQQFTNGPRQPEPNRSYPQGQPGVPTNYQNQNINAAQFQQQAPPQQNYQSQYQNQGPPPPPGSNMQSGPQSNMGYSAPPASQQYPPPPNQNYPPQNSQSYPPPPGAYTGSQPRPAMAPGYPQPNQSSMSEPPAGPGGFPQTGPNQFQQPPQPRQRLDPEMMPSPITVMAEDRKQRSSVFETGSRGQIPPLCTTDFVVRDTGNCSPRFLRSTVYNIPTTKDMCNTSRLPIVLALQPFAEVGPEEMAPPLADSTTLTGGPIRCNRCKAYMSPLMMFVDGGRKFECLLCGCQSEVPQSYFAHLDHTGRRVDAQYKPELCLGSYEFAATLDYCKEGKPPKPPVYLFMIDVSVNAIRSGLVSLLCSKLKTLLDLLPKDDEQASESKIKVGFATYTDVIHFYNLNSSQSKPQMQVVADVNDMFLPSLEGFMVQYTCDTKELIYKILDQIPDMFGGNASGDTVLGPVIQAGLDAVRSGECPGKLFIFHTGLPTRAAPGQLKPRDDRSLLGTDKEKTVLTPQTPFYTKLAKECVSAGCCVDLFLFPRAFIDIATLGEVCKLTGGQVHLYNNFTSDVDGCQLISDLAHGISRRCAFDAMVRVRTSAGVRPVDFLGNFRMETSQDVELACLDPDKCILVELKHDDKLEDSAGVHVQVALLYTTVGGERRLRVHNMSFNCTTQLVDLFKSVETDVLVNWLAKEAARALLKDSPKVVKERVMDLCANSLACYRKNCANPSAPGQLILPESMKLIPVYINNVLKSQAIAGTSDLTIDNRAFLMHILGSMNVQASAAYFYPRLIPIHSVETGDTDVPSAVRCSADKLRDDGAFILENGLIMFVWIGQSVGADWLGQVFGVEGVHQLETEGRHSLPELDNSLSCRVRDIVSQLRRQRSKHMKLYIVKQKDKLDLWFRNFLCEDKGIDNSPSYVDFLCHMHKEIRTLLN